jgi:hypothetical protein
MSTLVRRAINRRPRLRISQRKESLDLLFVFEGSIPDALKEEYHRTHHVLRKAKQKDKKAWTKILRKAYLGKGSEKGKRIQRGLHQYLHQLLVRALLILLEQAQGTEKSYPGIEEEIRLLREVASGKRGHPKSKRRQKRDAIRLARLYEALRPEIAALKKFVHGLKDDRLTGEAAEKAFKYKWLRHVIHGAALKNLPTISSSGVGRESHLTGKWQVWQLTVGVMYEQQDPKRFMPNTIAKYISMGKSLLVKKKTQAKKPA